MLLGKEVASIARGLIVDLIVELLLQLTMGVLAYVPSGEAGIVDLEVREQLVVLVHQPILVLLVAT